MVAQQSQRQLISNCLFHTHTHEPHTYQNRYTEYQNQFLSPSCLSSCVRIGGFRRHTHGGHTHTHTHQHPLRNRQQQPVLARTTIEGTNCNSTRDFHSQNHGLAYNMDGGGGGGSAHSTTSICTATTATILVSKTKAKPGLPLLAKNSKK